MRFLKRAPAHEPGPLNARVLADDADVRAAYRLILAREPDAEGLAHYAERLQAGLRLEDLIQELLTSAEFRSAARSAPRADERSIKPASNAGTDADEETRDRDRPERIDPKDVIARWSIEELNDTADEYYRRISDPTPLMVKPFAFLHETPEMLQNLGFLLAGLRLGKTMTVLDFGAGTCWLSRYLAQLNCQPICCDASRTALDIGRRLFAEMPLIGTAVYEPRFLPFDGHRLGLEDDSVDRIICFDAFHHVPNQREVLAEFARVLVPGGIIGFSEPGRRHSHSSDAQYEMRNHAVLENDIVPEDIAVLASKFGLECQGITLLTDRTVGLDTHAQLTTGTPSDETRSEVLDSVSRTISARSIFFLSKGTPQSDSRSHIGLAHRLATPQTSFSVQPGEPLKVTITATNTGSATWLHVNSEIFGTVRVGTHLYDPSGHLLEIDHARHALPCTVAPGATVAVEIEVAVPDSGCRLDVDLVSEGVSWFENLGSEPLHLEVRSVGL